MENLKAKIDNLVKEVERIVLKDYGVKCKGHFDIRDSVTVMISFATDRKSVRLVYFMPEIERGVNPLSIAGQLEEAFQLSQKSTS